MKEKKVPDCPETCGDVASLDIGRREFHSLVVKLVFCYNCANFEDGFKQEFDSKSAFLDAIISKIQQEYADSSLSIQLEGKYDSFPAFFQDAAKNLILFASTGELYTQRLDESIYQAIQLMADHNIRRVPVVDAQGKLQGIFTGRDIIRLLGRDAKFQALFDEFSDNIDEVLAQPVTRIMTRNPATVSQNHNLYDAIRLMADRKIGGLPIVFGEELVGIITERDVMDVFPMIEELTGKRAEYTPAKKVVTVRPEMTLRQAWELLARKHFRRLPVTDEKGIIVGIVTTTDLVNANGLLDAPFSEIEEEPLEKIMIKNLHYLSTGDPLEKAVHVMSQYNIGSLLYMEGDGSEVKGIITERDILKLANDLIPK